MLSNIVSAIESTSDFQLIVEYINSREILPNLAMPRAARLPLVAALHKSINKPILLITDRTDLALNLIEELSIWIPDITPLFFPEPNPLFYENIPWGVTTRRDRLLALITLASQQIPGMEKGKSSPIIIAPTRAVMTRTIPRRDFIKATRTIKIGQVIQPDKLVRDWISLGYQPVTTVINAGQFARRGGILDIWPANNLHPARLEFFGDEIDTLRIFNPSTQMSLTGKEAGNIRLLIPPAREFLSSNDHILTSNSESGLSEFDIPIIHPSPATILDYTTRDALIIIDNEQSFKETVSEVEEQSVGLRQEYIAEGSLPEDFPVPYLTLEEITESLSQKITIYLGPKSSSDEIPTPEINLGAKFSPNQRFGGQLRNTLSHFADVSSTEDQIVIVSRQIERLKQLWEDFYKPVSKKSIEPIYIKGSLSDGWIFNTEKSFRIHLFTDGELFGWQSPKPRLRHRPVAEAPEAAYIDLDPGDWVVHVDHGIGNFVGLVRRKIEDAEREYLLIEYAEKDQLFVPVHQADRLTRYVGASSRIPVPSRLGSATWVNTKDKVKKAVQEMAEDLLDLYAKRSISEGYAFSRDIPWQHDLEASFPYIETDDQLRVLEEVKGDMEAPRPMDRLVCGDVGYGKTEIAVRAAFKAVMDGKQVALLVPTTVLAQQHFYTFKTRLAAFPVETEMLSRFRSPKQQKDILSKLAAGAVDIIIGTHRLLSSDVEFKDLGLLIIDEEQRFGVTHKETLKRIRTEIDVLTMTATPIPRTLYMTLTGVRDISTINTPPEERLPIITHVGPYSERITRRAIIRELERGGQIFFVHNRVQTIGAMRNHLAKLVPEARIGVAHGQMAENILSERMQEFTDSKIDILLSTSIIESGLDIPNANTLIVDRADTFGLAQLYQLRGRVGRGAQRAYAYFFKHKQRSPTIPGSQRLETLAENTQLGSGFTIAMRDLEIRGAGDILGARQHGHIAAVGFHLYTRLLSDAVKQLRSDRGLSLDKSDLVMKAFKPLVSVDLPLHTNIPTEYVPDKTMRLSLYRRIADTQTIKEVDALGIEFTDRFGPLPFEVENLLYQMKIKLLASEVGFSNVNIEGERIILRFPEGKPPSSMETIKPYGRIGKTALWIEIPDEHKDWKPFLYKLLSQINENQSTN